MHAFAAIALLSASPFAALPAFSASSHASYVPGIAIVPDVLMPNGVDPRTYPTQAGLSYWTPDLPIERGDKVKLNVFVATGGADLRRMVIRLDNQKIADLTSSPWNTVVDTSRLAPGYHMVEAWAQGSGDRPQTSTKTLTFYVVNDLPAQYAVKDSEQLYEHRSGAAILQDNSAPQSSIDAPGVLPPFLAGRTVDPDARIVVRSPDRSVDSALTNGGPVTISSPAMISVQSPGGSKAVRYAYELVRNGQAIAASSSPQSMEYDRLRLRPRTETIPGLRTGALTLYVWGIDQIGRPSQPVSYQLNVVEAGTGQ